ncbi:MAG: hypothetical protein KF729_10330 [Sandaracinaceae bacterium]|nr:hypothetical protein [Sandaracinaceae bacterium]
MRPRGAWGRALALAAPLSLAALASVRAQPVVARQLVVHPVDVERPVALGHFRDALGALARDPRRRVRVMHFGDSNVAADLWTAVARETLQARYGDGGSGYLLPPRIGSWHRGPVRLEAAGEWTARRRGYARDYGPLDGRWGLAGVAMEPAGPAASLVAHLPSDTGPREVELHALGRPRPGRLEVRVDAGPYEPVALSRGRPELVVVRRSLDASAHRVHVRAAGGVPRVLGLVVERPSGLVYDVLGINGHRASAILTWDEALLVEQLRHRPPDLVVLSYGGNEALDRGLSLAAYEADTSAAIARVRRIAPDASCLLVGPLATFPAHAPRMGAVSATQRRLALRHGCGFWDSAASSGGPGTLERWARFPGMVASDRLHLGREGYARVGRSFVGALLRAVRAGEPD